MKGSSGDRRKAPRSGPVDASREAREEVEAHVALQLADLLAEGWTEEEARAEALRRFGDRGRFEREMVRIDTRAEARMRRARVLDEVGQDVRLAVRQLRQRPGFAAVAIGILALGIGASAAVFGVVDGALLRPLPFPEPEALVYVWDAQDGEPGFPASLPEFEDWRRGSEGVDGMMASATNQMTWTGGEAPAVLVAGLVAGDPAATLGVRPLLGRWFTAEELETQAGVVMLSEPLWIDRFGRDRSVVGTTMRLDGEPYTVIGVLPREAALFRAFNPPAVWVALPQLEFMTRGYHFLEVLARLSSGVTREEAQARFGALGASLRESGATDHGIQLSPVRDDLVGSVRSLLLILLGAVLLVLVIVCANVANLVLSKSLERGREFALRAALGAGRARLVRQIITESVVLALIGGAAGLLVAHTIAGGVRAVSQAAAALAPSTFDGRVFAFTLLVSLGVAIFFGVWPAARVTRTDLAGSLRAAGDGRTAGARGGWRRRRLLVGVEIALCLVLLAGAGLLIRSMRNLLAENVGFAPAGVLTFDVQAPPSRYDEAAQARFFAELLGRLRALPGVTAAAAASHLPLDRGDTSGGFEIVGQSFQDGEGPYAKKRVVSPAYFAALDIPVIRGRTFTETDRAGGPGVVLVSEVLAARYWPGEDPVGRRVRFLWGDDGEQEIVGVVGDVKHDGVELPVAGMMFRPAAQFSRWSFTILVETDGEAMALVQPARRVLAELDADIPLHNPRTMDDVVGLSIANRRTTMMLLSGFAAVALLLAAVGVYAVTAQAVAYRTREIGVRMAVGAGAGDVLRMVLREEMLPVGLGILAGLLGAVAATRVLTASLFGVGATDPVTFAAVAALLAAVAFAATYLPARRATRVDPMGALRTD